MKREWPKTAALPTETNLHAITPARLFVSSSVPAYPTKTYLNLRADHAAALDSVQAELDSAQAFDEHFMASWKLFTVTSQAPSKHEYLMRPDLGRLLDEQSRFAIAERCPQGADLQVAIGDGLSVQAIVRAIPELLPLLRQQAEARGWSFGQPLLIRHCRVGILNDLGTLLQAKVIVLLIGERPGLATAESLSAYMAYRPQGHHTDANRNLISNIHPRGVPYPEAAQRISNLASLLMRNKKSGFEVKETLALEQGLRSIPEQK